ncbi:acyltransferase [Parabacteroides sp. 52]|uniref:lysophospholipid acyltransferase family protein n=1 Tax=unclassified Parabacteroides TaxID=2649774 RepID=UPI0013D145F0|nr:MULTISPECIES: lysophospholipid acyltransferase family protein [unclassified Parabacteroides]MDH6534949.1 1-acyl-sn-glycerol-3-phosphate acyltransferase [Parabacteroides sp. PM5-20]NDV55672.1 acyltransferase [Parabacteroides sp. 52]
MKKSLSKAILRMAGWRIGSVEGVELPKCVICVAPHTSNWDFLVGKLTYTALGCTASFLIKKEWFFFPLNFLFKSMGGVPVDRRKHTSVTEQMAEEFAKRSVFQLAITPEATRKPVEEWKKGFYYIALTAQVPILMAYFDYSQKVVGILGVFYPTGDVDKDIHTIRSRYKGIKGRNPAYFIDI